MPRSAQRARMELICCVASAVRPATTRHVDTGALRLLQCDVEPLERGARAVRPMHRDIDPGSTTCSLGLDTTAAEGNLSARPSSIAVWECSNNVKQAVGLDEFHRPTGIAGGQRVANRLHEHVMVGEPPHCPAVQQRYQFRVVPVEASPQKLGEQAVIAEPIAVFVEPA